MVAMADFLHAYLKQREQRGTCPMLARLKNRMESRKMELKKQ